MKTPQQLYRERNLEKCRAWTREYMRKWRESHREEDAARTSRYRAANKEKVYESSKKSAKKWRENNPDLAKERTRQSNARWVANPANKAKKKQITNEWVATHPEWRSEKTRQRRKMVRQATPLWADHELIELVYAEAKHRGLTVDHCVPIQSTVVCGLHVHNNLQLMSVEDNSRKAKTIGFIVPVEENTYHA